MNRFLHIVFCAIWLSLLSSHSIAQSEEGDLDCLEFELLEKDEEGFQIAEGELIRKVIENFPDNNPMRRLKGQDFYYAEVDLNDDNQPEVFFLSLDSFFCGLATCSIQARRVREDGSLGRLLQALDPINVSPSALSEYESDRSFGQRICLSDNETNGWKDIIAHQGRAMFVMENGYYTRQRD